MEKIIFQGLPFKPVRNQVIYIESHYDDETNAFIVTHLEALRRAFRREKKEFFYLPLLTLDSAIEEKVLYAAPYLSQRVLGDTPVKSSALLDFVKDATMAVLGPSLIFDGRCDAKSGVSTFDLMPLDADGSPVSTLARFINSVPEECMPSPEECMPSPDERMALPDECMASPVMFRRDAKKKFVDRLQCPRHEKFSVSEPAEEGVYYDLCCSDEDAAYIPSLKEIEDEKLSIAETSRILQELRDNVQRLRLEGVSLMAIHEFIDRQEPLSRMVITPDYRILLPDYNNMEIEMGALPKAIYFLFLRYPDGIVCKHMPDYYTELLGIYRQLRPTTDEARLNLTVTKVVNPLGNALNENIARIRKAFVEKFDEHLACNYIITGERGQQYAVALDRGLITWEE